MRVILACLSSKYVHASLAPWCLYAGVREFCECGHHVHVFESTINADINSFAEKIISQKPDLVSFSSYIWNITKTLAICEKIKAACDCKIVLGGPEVAFRAQDILQNYPFIDFVLSGEGEYNFPKFLDALEVGGGFEKVDGLSYIYKGRMFSNPEKNYESTPPSPYCDEFFSSLGGRISYIETSRGCPYRCAFCLSGRCSPLRFFDMDRVKSDILILSQSGTRTVKFVDRTFNANSKRCDEILTFIKQNYGTEIPAGVCFHFEIAGDILKEDTLEILKSMPRGAVQLEIGMQSFNEETLRLINRKTDTQKLKKNIKTLLSFNNMHIHIDLIAGLTGEDLESFARSFNIGYNLGAHMLQLGFLKLLYGSDMRQDRERFPCEFDSAPPYEVTSTPWLSADDIKLLKGCEDALDRLYNSGRFLFSLEYLINQVGIEPFRLFCDFGNAVCGDKMSLSDYAQKFYEHFKDRCDGEILREKIVCDLLASKSHLHIPESLRISSPLHKKIRLHLEGEEKCSVRPVVLSKIGQVFAVSSDGNKDLFGRLGGRFYDLSSLLEKIKAKEQEK